MKNQPTMDEVMATMSLKDRLSLKAQFGAAFGQFYVPGIKEEPKKKTSILEEGQELVVEENGTVDVNGEILKGDAAKAYETLKEAATEAWKNNERRSANTSPSKPKQQPYNVGSKKLKKQLAVEKEEKKRLLRQAKRASV